MAGGNFGGGTGTEQDPYLVEDAADLRAVGHNNSQLSLYFKQVRQIDLKGINWTPVSAPFSSSMYPAINYDGDKFTISNMSIKMETTSSSSGQLNSIGLFDDGYDHIKLSNVILTDFSVDVTISGEYWASAELRVGGLAGSAYYLHDCIVKNGKVKVTKKASLPDRDVSVGVLMGGPAGVTSIRRCGVENCEVEVTLVDDPSKDWSYLSAGLFMGRSYLDFIYDCYATGKIRGYASHISGFIGLARSVHLYRCYCAVDITGVTSVREGAVITPMMDIKDKNGYSTNSVQQCYYDADVAKKSYVGLGSPSTTPQMKKQNNFVYWDFNSIWSIKENQTYPFFEVLNKYRLKGIPLPLELRKMRQ